MNIFYTNRNSENLFKTIECWKIIQSEPENNTFK